MQDTPHKKYGQNLPRGFVTPEKAKIHAETLANSVRKRFRHLAKRFKREGIEVFRLYDWDSPDIRIVVDWYAGHIVVAEYERMQTGPEYLPFMAQAVGQALNVPKEKIHTRRRHTKTADGPRYKKLDARNQRFQVREQNLRFWVNLEDFLDTGLFSDHRNTRQIISSMSQGKDFLNLFAYTGSFTCAAALGKAKSTVTVDRSQVHINWAKDNSALNGLIGPQHTFIRADALHFLAQAMRLPTRYNLAFVDPPSFFNDERDDVSFDVNRDHPALIKGVLKVMLPGSDLFFSTNHQRFEPRFEGLPVKSIVQLTPKTIPEDYRNRGVHHCWQMKV